MIRVAKKLYKILTKEQQRYTVFLVVMMLIGGVMESLGVTLIMPLIKTVTDSKGWDATWYGAFIRDTFGISTVKAYMQLILVLLIVIFVVKNLFLLWEYYLQYTFIARSRYGMQKQLVNSYINKPYLFYLNASSGEIMRIVSDDTGMAFTMLQNILIFATEVIVSVILAITIIIISPVIAMILALLLVVEVLLIAKVIKPVMKSVGDRYRAHRASANKWLLQSINGVKSIKVANTGRFFEEKYNDHSIEVVDAERKNATLQNVPRLIIEAVTVAGVLGFVLFMVGIGTDLASIIPQLSAFMVAAVRLLPSVNRISNSINCVPYYEGALDNVINNIEKEAGSGMYADLDAEKKAKEAKHKAMEENDADAVAILDAAKAAMTTVKNPDAPAINFEKDVKLSGVTFSYPNSDRKILDVADMEIKSGESVGIVGPSGAGKTTAIDIILGLLKPLGGKVTVDDIDIEENMDGWLSNLAYIPQSIYMMDDTIRANVAFGYHKCDINDDEVWRALDEAQMKEFVASLPEGLDTTIGEFGVRLSGGQKQRIGIARALYNNPKILFFDEATSALDNETEAAIMDSINHLKGHKTLVIIAHRLTTIENCDLVYRVEGGKIQRER